MPDYEHIVVEQVDGVGTITLNRPKVLNALDSVLFRELDDALNELEEDDGTCAVVVTGAGERAFSAGADIHEMARQADANSSTVPDPARAAVYWRIASYRKPTIGAINGLAYGGGAVIASSLDIRVGCANTTFKFLAASYGRVNSTWNLPLQVGWPIAKELLFTAREVGAEEASEIGLLNHLVSPEEVLPKAMEIGAQIAGNDPRMVQGIKDLLIRGVGEVWDDWSNLNNGTNNMIG